MTAAPHKLKAVVERECGPSRCTLVCQAMLSGSQEISVRVLTPVSGAGDRPRIGVRVGPLLLLVSDRDALNSVLDACRHAGQLASEAFDTQES